ANRAVSAQLVGARRQALQLVQQLVEAPLRLGGARLATRLPQRPLHREAERPQRPCRRVALGELLAVQGRDQLRELRAIRPSLSRSKSYPRSCVAGKIDLSPAWTNAPCGCGRSG